ncbi:hypothetical protein pb186bvf_006165 [Paramecium bursaria]
MDINDFEILKKLGSGSFSSVYKVKRKSDSQEYAMKKVMMNGLQMKEKQNALNEVRILASLNSPHIIGYREAFIKGDTLFLILEYAGGGDLQQKIEYIRRKGSNYFLEETLIWNYIADILQGLNALHSNNIFHRDIKCANLFLTTNHKNLKLGDLNVAKVVKPNILASTQAGTPYYASPEVWKDQPYDQKCDIWSLGCVLYEMAQLMPPFLANDMNTLSKRIIKGIYDQIHPRYSKELSHLISRCLQVNPKNRATCQELMQFDEVRKRIQVDHYQSTNGILNTIYLPKHYKDITLPRPRYQTDNSDASITKRPLSRQIRSNNCSVDSESPKQKLQKIVIPALKRSVSQNTSQLKENAPPNLYQLPIKKSPRGRKQSPHSQARRLQAILKLESDLCLPPIEARNGHRKLSSKLEVKKVY